MINIDINSINAHTVYMQNDSILSPQGKSTTQCFT